MKNAIELYHQHVALAATDIDKVRKALWMEKKQLSDFIYSEWKTAEDVMGDLRDEGLIEQADARALVKQWIDANNTLTSSVQKYKEEIDKIAERLAQFKNAYR